MGPMTATELMPDSAVDTRPDSPTPLRISLVSNAVEDIDQMIEDIATRRDDLSRKIIGRLNARRIDLCSWERSPPKRDVSDKVLTELKDLKAQVRDALRGVRS
jgi:hypothetical protein